MNTKTLLIAFFAVLSQSLFAIPAVPWLVEEVLYDGSVVEVYIRGDEKMSWFESLDGYTLLHNKDKVLVYAELDKHGNMLPSDIPYGQSLKKSIQKGLHYSPAQINHFLEPWQNKAKSSREAKAVVGKKKALCILVGFNDRPFNKSQEEFDAMMNQIGYNQNDAHGSVKDFYLENSYNQMDLEVTVAGPYTLSESQEYYSNRWAWYDFAFETIGMAANDLNFKDYANDNNELESVHIIFAGYGDEAINNGQQIWSHAGWLDETFDGVYIPRYSCSPELYGRAGNNICGIGVICHELCHVFGAPDYYDADYEESGGRFPGTGSMDLMAAGGYNGNGKIPCHINMYQKILFGWVEPTFLTLPTSVSQMPDAATSPTAYIIKIGTEGEEYILENRQTVGFDSAIPSQGLIIYHIHKNVQREWRLNTSHPQMVYIVDASSTYDIPDENPYSYGYSGAYDSFNGLAFGSKNHSEFSGTSVPAMFSWDGSSLIYDRAITNIRHKDKFIYFDFMGGLENPCKPVENLKASQEDNVFHLTWDAPSMPGVNFTYGIYLDDEWFVGGLTEPEFTYEFEAHGEYTFGVVTEIEYAESEARTIRLSYNDIRIDYLFPADKATNVVLDSDLRVVFNQSVTGKDRYGASIWEGDTELEDVSIRVKRDTLFIMHPEFKPETTYSVKVNPYTISDYWQAISWSFTTTKGDGVWQKTENPSKVYPTITESSVAVETSEKASIYVRDITGQVLDVYISDGHLDIDIDYGKGIYLISIESENIRSVHKIIRK